MQDITNFTPARWKAIRAIEAGNGIHGHGFFNGNAANKLRDRGLIEGRGWPSDRYRLTAAGEATVAQARAEAN